MKPIVTQVALAIMSFWGLLYIPLAMTIRLTTDASHPFLHSASQFLTLSIHLLWFAPSAWITYMCGIQNYLYDIDIAVGVKHPLGWILPALFWFIAGNLLLWTVNMIRKRKSQQGGPAYPPQGVGSADP